MELTEPDAGAAGTRPSGARAIVVAAGSFRCGERTASLRAAGYRTVCADGPAAFLARLGAFLVRGEAPDRVDWLHPDATAGLSILAGLRRNGHRTRFVLEAAELSGAERSRALRLGAVVSETGSAILQAA